MKSAIIFTAAIIIAGVTGYMTQQYLAVDAPPAFTTTGSALVGTTRQEFMMVDTDGSMRNINEWDGKVVLLNFWATWCPPCKKEIPHFIELQEEFGDQGLQVVGVAMDNAADVAAFSLAVDMNYPSFLGDMDVIDLARRYGNAHGGLPYTVIIDKNATISSTFMGELSKEHALKLLREAGLGT